MITLITAVCAFLNWTPGLNAVEYDFYEDMIYAFTVSELEAEVCRIDYDVEVTYYVVGVGVNGESEPSGILTVKWVFDADADKDGVVGFLDFGLFMQAFDTDDPFFDFDESGWVGFPDYGAFILSFGTCNDGTVVVPCPAL